MGGNFEDETTAVEVLNLKGIEDGGQVICFELDVYDGTDDGFDETGCGGCLGSIRTRSRSGGSPSVRRGV